MITPDTAVKDSRAGGFKAVQDRHSISTTMACGMPMSLHLMMSCQPACWWNWINRELSVHAYGSNLDYALWQRALSKDAITSPDPTQLNWTQLNWTQLASGAVVTQLTSSVELSRVAPRDHSNAYFTPLTRTTSCLVRVGGVNWIGDKTR